MHQLQLVDKQIQSSTKALHSAIFPITTMNPHPTTTFRGCYGLNLHSTEGRRQQSRNGRENAIARIQFLLSLLEKKLQNPPTEITYY